MPSKSVTNVYNIFVKHTKPGFLKSKKMLRFILLYTHKIVSENTHVYNIILNG